MTGGSHIVAGQEISGTSFLLDPAMVRIYTSAVEESSPVYQDTELVPPTAIAALGVRTILKELGLPPGTLHAAQEMSMSRAVATGEELSCAAQVTQSSQRRGWQFVVVEFSLADHGGKAVLDGRTTLMVPQQDS
jgi:hypothetical protein